MKYRDNNASLSVWEELSLFPNREAMVRIGTRIFLARTYYYMLACLLACLLANKIIRTAKEVGGYFHGVLDVCQHVISLFTLLSAMQSYKKLRKHKEKAQIILSYL